MPPKNKKKDTKRKELSEDDMRRLGMNEDDIARILAERGKSTEDKKADQEREEAQRREAEQRQRAQKELTRLTEELVKAEADPRVAILHEEDAAWCTLEPPLALEKARVLRSFLEKEAVRKAEEAKRKREHELAAYKASLESMSEEERARLIAQQQEEEKRRQEEVLRQEQERLRKEERREVRRKARIEKMRSNGVSEVDAYLMSQVSSDDEEVAGTGKKKAHKAKQEAMDEMDFAMRERYAS